MHKNPFSKTEWIILCKILLAFFIFGTVAYAQEPARSLDQLKLVLAKGDKIALVDSSGKSIKGNVTRFDSEGLDLRTGGKIQTFSSSDIQQITRKKADSPLNGILTGAGIGFGVTLPFNLILAGSGDISNGMALASSGLWGLIGGGIGALIDAAVHEKQLVYARPKRGVSWSVHPFYGDRPIRMNSLAGERLQGSSHDFSKGLQVTLQF
jgi:hypothetical protein